MIEQLHCSGPTDKISWIIKLLLILKGKEKCAGRVACALDSEIGFGYFFAGVDCVVFSPERTE